MQPMFIFLAIAILGINVSLEAMDRNSQRKIRQSLHTLTKLGTLKLKGPKDTIYEGQECLYPGPQIIEAKKIEKAGCPKKLTITYDHKIQALCNRLASIPSCFSLQSEHTNKLIELHQEKIASLQTTAQQLTNAATDQQKTFLEQTASLSSFSHIKIVDLFVHHLDIHKNIDAESNPSAVVEMVTQVYEKFPHHTLESSYLFFAIPTLFPLLTQKEYRTILESPYTMHTFTLKNTLPILPLKMAGAIIKENKKDSLKYVTAKSTLWLGHYGDPHSLVYSVPRELLSRILFLAHPYALLDADHPAKTMFHVIEATVKEN